MPTFLPFPGLRYDPTSHPAEQVTAPPYDVLDEHDRDELCQRHPDNVVVVDLPRADDGSDAYAAADATFARWRADGVLRSDPDAFYVYRMSWADEQGSERSTTGVLGALELSPPGEGGILPHEETTPKAASDRLRLLQATRVNLSPIWGLSPAAGLTELLPTDGEPAVDFRADDGVRHQVWVVTDPAALDAISAAVGGSPVVIADGHHRYHTSLAYRDERVDELGADEGASATLVWVVELVERELTVQPIHRLVRGIGPSGPAAVFGARFELAETSRDEAVEWAMAGRGPALVTADGAWTMQARADAFDGVRDLDTARLAATVADADGVELAYQHGVDNVLRLVDAGDADGTVLVRPVSVAAILEIAHGGERMPPKTTFFAPKAQTGLVFRALDG